MKRFYGILVVAVLWIHFLLLPVEGQLRLPAIIGDNMVLQQGSQATLWGWTEPGEKVSVKAEWQWLFGSSCRADDQGYWQVKIGTPKKPGPYQIVIKDSDEQITVKNVLCGEVWVCSGQSNMDFRLGSSNDAETEISNADYPQIRLFYVEHAVADEPQSDCKVLSWEECTPEAATRFSAVGYFFGRYLHQKLNVPVGLIHTAYGGTPAESWTKREYLESDPDFIPILERHARNLENYPQAMEEYKQKMERWKQDAEAASQAGEEKPREPRKPHGPGHPWTPCGLYNAMISPLIPYRIQGAIWYQGESNDDRAWQYRKLFPAMIGCWREQWGQGDFPFGFVQLANYDPTKPEPGESDWAELREAQTMTLSEPNTGMAVIIDIGDAGDIHPTNKQDVGKRLALWALAKVYKQKNLVYSGPMYRSMKVIGDTIVLEFDHVGSGLVAKGGPLTGFAIAGADRKFIWAKAEIAGDTILVRSEKIANPASVRYAWAINPVCNLYNKEGLPASPFRTDCWPGLTDGKK